MQRLNDEQLRQINGGAKWWPKEIDTNFIRAMIDLVLIFRDAKKSF